MLYSRHLLNQWISLDKSTHNIADQLVLRSCEIEHTYDNQLPELVVIGLVTEVVKHPQADTLYICQVDCWPRGVFQIITWWENIIAQAQVAVALPGCYLPVVDLTIWSRTMRGVESNGMICSKEELWIKEDIDKHWIRLLQEDINDITKEDYGISLSIRYPRLASPTWEVDNKTITHRPDMTWHFWLALELRAIYTLIDPHAITFQSIDRILEQLSHFSPLQVQEHIPRPSIEVQVRTSWCQSYQLIECNNIRIQRSSLYIRRLLWACNMNDRNNWIDFSNLWMLKTWQPIHCFDRDRIEWAIIVRDAFEWEIFVDLHEKEHSLTSNDIVIADSVKILALAWIIWWLSSAIQDNTTSVVIEMAHFDAVRVRKTALRLSSRTDASMRFEKAINPLCSVRFVPLLLDELLSYHQLLCIDIDVVRLWSCWMSEEVKTQLVSPTSITVDINRLLRHIYWDGVIPAHQEQSYNILSLLWCKIDRTNEAWVVTPPWRRWSQDILSMQDLTEEVARISGYDEIVWLPSYHPMNPIMLDSLVQARRTIEELLSLRFNADQVETYPRHNIKDNEILGDSTYKILSNPMSSEYTSLRNSMIPNLLRVVQKNQWFFDRILCYDIWQVRTAQWEQTHVGIVLSIPSSSNWKQDSFLLLKEIITSINDTLRISWSLSELVWDDSRYHPKKQLSRIYNDLTIAGVRQLHPMQQDYRSIWEQMSTSIAYINLSDLVSMPVWSLRRSYVSLQDQIVYRDLNVVIDADQSFDTLIDVLKTTPCVYTMEIFDIYTGDTLPADKKSFACRLWIVHKDGLSVTMTTEYINEVLQHTITRAQSIWAILRKDFVV